MCFILLPSSPSPLLSTVLLPSSCSVLTFPTLVVPVHSIRLEYGCVVVDTCTVWSVSQCCRVMISSSSWCHQTRSSRWINGDKRWKGWPRFPKQEKNKHWLPFHALLIPVEPCLELSRSAQCHSGIFLWIWGPTLYCMYLSDDILLHCNVQM